MTTTRRLAAIVVADVVGYSRLMEADEAGTLAALKERRKTILEPTVREHGGRIVKVMGDGVLIEFASAVKAVEAAVEIQLQSNEANARLDEARRITLRIGINLGDVVGDGDDIFGDGVNVAARLESLAEPGSICISAKVHAETRGKIAAEFEDIGEQKLKNISSPVRAFRSLGGSASSVAAKKDAEGRLSIAVLPFDNMSGDPAQQYISDGITEDIITELARFRGLAVAARHASFHYAGKGKSIAEVARELGVVFVVEGSVRISAGRIRITAQLIDARTGDHVWADRFDRDSQNVFAIQDQVVSSIVSMLEGRMIAKEAAIARGKAATSWSAYDCLLQGREYCNRFREPDAVPLFAQAIAIDPHFALAHAWLAIALTISNIGQLDPAWTAQADVASKRALELDAKEATSQWARGLYLLWNGEVERAQSYFEHAMALNPADIQIKGDYASWQRVSGKLADALATIDQAIGQGPFVPDWFTTIRGHVLFDLERYAEAVEAFEAVPPHYCEGLLTLGAARIYLDDAPGAADAIAKANSLNPGLSLRDVARMPYHAMSRARERLIVGLRRAGMPE